MIGFALGAGLVGGVDPASAQPTTVPSALADEIKQAVAAPPSAPSGTTVPAAPATGPGSAPANAPLSITGASGPAAPAAPPTPPALATQAAQPPTGHEQPHPQSSLGVPFGSAPAKPPPARRPSGRPPASGPTAPALRAATGLTLAANPAFALGPPAIGVPNFFIDSFAIPPFLVSIFQAAGVHYDVPWQVLAAINEIETDYGRNLSVSSAGAIGWMQFLPSTWRQYGVDANGDGVKDPYNPVDAIFGAARFLHAAGASSNLRNAVFAYNNASWYVDSVLLRAKLIGGLPSDLVSSITGLTDGLFPIHAPARYADPAHAARAGASSPAIDVYADAGSPVVAVHDGTITDLGRSPTLGAYIDLRDAYGNTYIYSQLKHLNDRYAAAKPPPASAAPVARALTLPRDLTPPGPASAGHQAAVTSTIPAAALPQPGPHAPATDTTAGPRRLFAHPARPAAFAAGGRAQVTKAPLIHYSTYFIPSSGLSPNDVTLRPLTPGARVVAGTILGRIGVSASRQAPHVTFQIRPAGTRAPLIDPTAILDGWKLLEGTTAEGAAAANPLFGPTATSPTLGPILLETKAQLQAQVLADPAIDIYACGRSDIQAGRIDQRVLATLEYLAASGLKPTVTALRCGNALANTAFAPTGDLSDLAAGDGVDISAINGVPVLGHQGPGSITDTAIRALLTVPGSAKPTQIVSLFSYPSTDNTFAKPDHADRLHVGFAPVLDPRSKPGQPVLAPLDRSQWLRLVAHLGQLTNPRVPRQPSSAAIPTRRGH